MLLTVPTEGVALLHTPPDAASVNAVLAPTQVTAVPVIVPAFGAGFTVSTLVAEQPVTLFEMVRVVVPADTAVTTPPGLVMVATPGVLLVHVLPLPAISVSAALAPTHKLVVPPIGPMGVTETVVLPVAVTPQISVIVRLYVVVTVGETTTEVPGNEPGLHE